MIGVCGKAFIAATYAFSSHQPVLINPCEIAYTMQNATNCDVYFSGRSAIAVDQRCNDLFVDRQSDRHGIPLEVGGTVGPAEPINKFPESPIYSTPRKDVK